MDLIGQITINQSGKPSIPSLLTLDPPFSGRTQKEGRGGFACHLRQLSGSSFYLFLGKFYVTDKRKKERVQEGIRKISKIVDTLFCCNADRKFTHTALNKEFGGTSPTLLPIE